MTQRAQSTIEPLEPRRLYSTTIPRPDHVVVVIDENHSYGSIIGNADAPYINSLARAGASFTDYRSLTSPSQPNYLALFSGSTQGVTNDTVPHTFTAPSLGGQLISKGLGFAGYSEDLPSVGFTGASSGGYRRRHNPWVNFTDVPAADNLPLTSFPTPANYSKLPAVSFVVPNMVHDMHDGTVKAGDDWLKAHLDPYVQWAKTHNSLFVFTFDEKDKTSGLIPTLLVGPMVNPGNYAGTVNHYNLLRTIEQMYGLSPLGNAAAAAPITNVWKASTSHTTTLGAAADTYIWDGAPTTNYGTSSVLDVKTNTKAGINREAYLKFNTTSATGLVTGAKLRFFGKLSAAESFAMGVFAVADTAWAEGSPTWRSCPRFGSRLGTVTVTSTVGGWYELDLTSYVKAERAAGRNTIALGLHGLASTVAKLSINSRESGTTGPQLVLTTG
jgi:hypothetical protein